MEDLPRLARDSDKKDVLSFCKKTFSWGDYIHEVWDSWIVEGNLIVIENQNIEIANVSKDDLQGVTIQL